MKNVGMVIGLLFCVGCATPHIPYTVEMTPPNAKWQTFGDGVPKSLGVINPTNVSQDVVVKCEAPESSFSPDGFDYWNTTVKAHGEQWVLVQTEAHDLWQNVCSVASYHSHK